MESLKAKLSRSTQKKIVEGLLKIAGQKKKLVEFYKGSKQKDS